VYYSQTTLIGGKPMRRLTTFTLAVLSAGLIFAASHPASAGGGCHSDTLTDAPGTAVSLEKRCFEPMVIRIDAGQQVTWTNNDPDIHAVAGVANSWGDDSELAKGDRVTYQFDEEGVYPYFCYLHPSMVGAVVVGDGGPVSASAARDRVKAVSAEAPGGTTNDEPAQALAEDSGGRVGTVPIAIGAGVLASLGGFACALLLRRKTAAS
jgi:plastocyanin